MRIFFYTVNKQVLAQDYTQRIEEENIFSLKLSRLIC